MTRARVPVIGLAGTIGAGKSALGAALARRGCVVSDSDLAAKEALQRPEVRDELVRWWGDRVIDARGMVDRGAVAGIVFANPAERSRLEALVHPKVHAARALDRKRAEEAGAPALIIDAPLLYEAGVDRECDLVVFVDAPRAERVRRVREGRGWDETELARREAAQMPASEKKKRAGMAVMNDGGLGELDRAAAEVLRAVGVRT